MSAKPHPTEPPLWEPTAAGWRQACAEALEKRLGWLKIIVAQTGGNLSELPDHQQRLWLWRERAVGEFNRIGLLTDSKRRIRDYRKLWIELS